MKAKDNGGMRTPVLPFIFLKRGITREHFKKECSFFIVGSKSRV